MRTEVCVATDVIMRSRSLVVGTVTVRGTNEVSRTVVGTGDTEVTVRSCPDETTVRLKVVRTVRTNVCVVTDVAVVP